MTHGLFLIFQPRALAQREGAMERSSEPLPQPTWPRSRVFALLKGAT